MKHSAWLMDRPLLIDPRRVDAWLDMEWISQALGAMDISDSGIAVIKVTGALSRRGDFIGMGSYQTIGSQLKQALADPNVNAVLLDIDSPGGEAAGVFDLADQIYAARGQKPIYALASDMACSGAYLIASAADKVFTTRTAELGSIGVVTAHIDMSKAAEKQGVAVTYIYAGDHKVDGNPFQPLPADVKARIQGDIDSIYSIFVSAVARNRGLPEDAVRKTQALTYMGADAVAAGLADEIGTYESVFAELSAIPGASRRSTNRGSSMTKQSEPEREATVTAPESKAVAAVDIAKACADAGMMASTIAEMIAQNPTAEQLSSKVEAFKTKQAAEAERIGAIKDACAAAHQEDLAATFIEAGMNIASVRTLLGKLAERSAEIDSRAPAPAAPGKALDVTEIYRRLNAVAQSKG